ncbi:hypothetical protein [Mycobacterium sp.]|uniref:hypothetical protein n=1 Tax=Mycobacterium sp. TaxID=1785 RepID=UPI003C7921C8
MDDSSAVTVSTAPSTPSKAQRRIPGEQGTWVFLLGDMLVFGAFFATFMVERSKNPGLFDGRARRCMSASA